MDSSIVFDIFIHNLKLTELFTFEKRKIEMQMNIDNHNDFNNFISENKSIVAYFSTPDCNVCKILKPKLIEFLKDKFPKIKFGYIDISKTKTVAGQNSVFAVPTILFFFDGKEFIRKSRNINFTQLDSELNRIYSLIYD